MNNTLLIGGNGYIGSALYPKIEADSVDLCLFGKNLGYSIQENYNDIDVSGYKNIILLAGHSSVQMCEYNKSNAWINNVDYFYNLCEKISKDQLLVYASSGSVYGQNPYLSTEENISINAINHYDLTKITVDMIANKFINDGKNIIGLRFGTVNGKSINTRSDLMINSMIFSYKNHNNIKTKNDWVKRPLLAIEDLTDGICKVLDSNIFAPGQYNMCSFNTTVQEVAMKVSEKTGCEIIKMEDDEKYYDFQISSKKFESTFNFQFKESVESIIDTLLSSDFSLFAPRINDDLFNLKLCTEK